METTEMPLAERIARGVDLLDEKHPGWDHNIDLDRLNIVDQRSCVLGQVFGYYGDGLETLGLSGSQFNNDTGAPYGFDLFGDEWFSGEREEELDRLWRQVIENRKATTN